MKFFLKLYLNNETIPTFKTQGFLDFMRDIKRYHATMFHFILIFTRQEKSLHFRSLHIFVHEKMTRTNRQPSQKSTKRKTNSKQIHTDLQKIEVGSGA